MQKYIFLLSILVPICLSVYDYIPGGMFKDFVLRLKYADKIELMRIIFDPHKSRSQVLKEVQGWAHSHSPLIEEALDRSVFNYQSWLNRQNNNFYQLEISENAKELGNKLRSILTGMNLSEHDTCNQLSDAISKATPEARDELSLDEMDCAWIFKRLDAAFRVDP